MIRPRHGGAPRSVAAPATLAVAALSVAASAQEHRRVMITDDGSGPVMFHVSSPDLRGLRKPDYVREDLPLFVEKLGLDEYQVLVLETLLETYLTEFRKIVEESLPAIPVPGPPGAQAHDGAWLPPPIPGDLDPDGAIAEALRDAQLAGDGLEVEFDAGGPAAVAIAVTTGDGEGGFAVPEGADVVVRAGGAGPGGDGDPAPRPEIMIAVGGREIPEEVRAKLDEVARELAEQITRRLEEAMAAGMDHADALAPDADRIEQQRAFFESLAEEARKFRRLKARLGQEFVAHVQGQLAPEQLERWPDLDRALVRRKTLPAGRLDGERTDLLAIAGTAEVPPEQKETVDGTLHEYEVALHEALTRRNEFLEDAMEQIDQAVKEGDHDKSISIADRAAGLRVAVRGVNEQFAEAIAGQIATGDAAAAEAFRAKVLRASFPRVYGPTRAQRAFAEARKLEGIDPALLAGIDELEAAYLQGLPAFNERLREAIRRHQPAEPRRPLEAMKRVAEGPAGGEGPGAVAPVAFDLGDDPVREAFQRRSDHDERFMKQLYAMLTPEQVQTLPRLPSESRRAPASAGGMGQRS